MVNRLNVVEKSFSVLLMINSGKLVDEFRTFDKTRRKIFNISDTSDLYASEIYFKIEMMRKGFRMAQIKYFAE